MSSYQGTEDDTSISVSPSGVWRDLDTFHKPREKDSVLPWPELVETEHRRRSILKRSELPIWRILFFWDGTCLSALCADWLLWLTILIYGVVRWQVRASEGMPGYVEQLSSTDIGIIGGFLSFFLVLFVNQTNTRFNEMYKASMGCTDRIVDVAQLSSSLPRHIKLRLIRYMNAAHAAGYVGLSNTYTQKEFFKPLNKTYKLLHETEMDRINALNMNDGSDAHTEIVQWVIRDIDHCYEKSLIDAREKSSLKDNLCKFAGSMGDLYDFTDQPVHFFYIHFLCLLSSLYLPLFAIDSACSAGGGDEIHLISDILSGLIVVLQAIFVIGLRVLGQKMIDPYGSDLEDLSVMTYVIDAWEKSNRILSAQQPAPISIEMEDELEREKRASLGKPWEQPKLLEQKTF